jgi:hypothetical protein
MWGVRTDTTGSGIGPRQFGLLQDVDLTVSFTAKELYGQSQFPAALARGQGKVKGKAKFARINVRLYSDVFFGLTASTGNSTTAQYEAATIPATTPFTATVANAATFIPAGATLPLGGDLGVNYASNGDMFNYVTTPTNPGEYTVNPATGVYTFAAVDAGLPVQISYNYRQAATALQVSVTNQPQGTTPFWAATIFQKISPGAPGAAGQMLPWMVYLPACHANSLSIPTAQDAWTMNAFDFDAFADPTGLVMQYNAVKQ